MPALVLNPSRKALRAMHLQIATAHRHRFSDGVGWRRDMIAVFQIMIALKDINEPMFPSDRIAYSSDDFEMNRRDAESYLDGVTRSANDET
jgi:hypothetical protein